MYWKCNTIVVLYIINIKGVIQRGQTTLSVRMDENVKKALDEFCADVGMNTSVAINMFAKAVLREHRLPFDVVSYNTDTFYNKANQERLEKAAKRMEMDGGTEHDIIEVDND